MPAKSHQQRKLIFAKRGQYGSMKNTPEKWKWVWEEGWENKGKLLLKVRKKKKNESVITFSEFVLNEGLITLSGRVDVSEYSIQSRINRLQEWFDANQEEDYCYINMYGHSDWRVNRDTIEKDVRDAARLATLNEQYEDEDENKKDWWDVDDEITTNDKNDDDDDMPSPSKKVRKKKWLAIIFDDGHGGPKAWTWNGWFTKFDSESEVDKVLAKIEANGNRYNGRPVRTAIKVDKKFVKDIRKIQNQDEE